MSTYDDDGRYVGPCPDCATDHDGHPGPETMGGLLACLRAQAAALGATHLVDQADMTREWIDLATANTLGLPVYADDAGFSR